jgi:DNA-binding NtrC family response regulator
MGRLRRKTVQRVPPIAGSRRERSRSMGRVLVIDDEAQILTLLRRGLELAGHEVVEASNGAVGLRHYREQPFDLVITDILMPEQEGLESILELRELDPNVRIIAISGGSGSVALDVLDLARRLGARRTFSKPFELGQIVTAVQEELENRRAA